MCIYSFVYLFNEREYGLKDRNEHTHEVVEINFRVPDIQVLYSTGVTFQVTPVFAF